MEPVVGNPFPDDAIHRRSVYFATKGRWQGGAGIVDQHDENVRRIGGQPARLNALLVDRLLHRAAGNTGRWRRGKWKGFLSFQLTLHVKHSISSQSSAINILAGRISSSAYIEMHQVLFWNRSTRLPDPLPTLLPKNHDR